MKSNDFLIYIFSIILVCFLFHITAIPIWYSAYSSTSIACKVENNIQLTQAETNSIVATTNYNVQTEVINITYIKELSELSPIILKHEHIHVKQFEQHRIFYCFTRVGFVLRYLAELEAYTFSYLPDSIYKILYGRYN